MLQQQTAQPVLQHLAIALLQNELSADQFQASFNRLSMQDRLTLLELLDSRMSKKEPPWGGRRS